MKPIVVKIGGSTFGKNETTAKDLVTLQKRKIPVVVVHGGGNMVTEWLQRLNIPTRFIKGLRVTDLDSLKVVIAILAGLVNKELVSTIWQMGGKAIGLSGADGGLITAQNKNPELGYTGEQLIVDVSILRILLETDYMPVIAPISLGRLNNVDNNVKLLNVNGDTAAGQIAASLEADKLIFLTNVSGIHDKSNQLIRNLSPENAKELIASGIASGGMDAKIESCLAAVNSVRATRIIDGRVPNILIKEMDGTADGTTIAR